MVDLWESGKGRQPDCMWVTTKVYPEGLWLQPETDWEINPTHWQPLPAPPERLPTEE